MKEYRTICTPCEIEIEIKKSRFIGRLFPVADLDEAGEILASLKKRYWDATHNCSAMIVGEYTRCSDDGEPAGTAGVPMLEALKHSGLSDILAVVTRYFGGTLLGAGGLVRAYTRGVSECVAAASKIIRTPYNIFRLELPFKLWGKAEALLHNNGFKVKDVEYSACVRASVYINLGCEDKFLKSIAELTSGTSVPFLEGTEYLDIPYK